MFSNNDYQHEALSNSSINKKWFLSLKKVVTSFFGSEMIAPLFFEHGRSIGQFFFYEIQENSQSPFNSSEIYVNRISEWLRKNNLGILEIADYEPSKKYEFRITNYLQEIETSPFYCGLLTGLLECIWEKDIEINVNQDRSEREFKLVLQTNL
jgi:hypothetical protein